MRIHVAIGRMDDREAKSIATRSWECPALVDEYAMSEPRADPSHLPHLVSGDPSFELQGTGDSQSGARTRGVVPVIKAARQASERILDVVWDLLQCLPCAVGKQGFGNCVVKAAPDPGHRLPEAVSGKGRPKGVRGVLASVIRVHPVQRTDADEAKRTASHRASASPSADA